MIDTVVTAIRVPEGQRLSITADLFGAFFPMRLEPAIFNLAGQLAESYNGGYWLFYVLSNGVSGSSGFYMAPDFDHGFHVVCENGFQGDLSADALGITACLYAYSHLSFSAPPMMAEVLADQYHWLREYAMDHAEAGAILAACD